ncbi:AraC family transcriptional regulator [Paenibacillus sp. A3]|uniref:AraC family transcriptional regulator n=1 Tax=Paenibacillus sp. A3 TaxID=1337054 RepID=UPI0006D54805|nr:helix-turn-helix domain-containing protein [Paenibacillus sp. A3]KPV58824.1 AraC family transcriptional regulator [Paenibacillus sp. A3]
MRRQSFLPTLNEHEYLLLPESVGWYKDPEHEVLRKAGALNNFSIHLIVDGKGYLETDGQQHTLHRGDAFLYFPLQSQRYYSSKDDPWEVRWVHFYGKTLKEFLLERGIGPKPLWKIPQWKPLEQALADLLEELEQNGFWQLTRVSTLTYAILAEFVTQAVPWSEARSPEADNRISELLPEMQRDACLPFDLQHWADRAGVSSYYFCRLFKKATHLTPMTFITLCRLQNSKQWLLEQPQLTVKEIAERAGYPSVSYYNKRFLEQEGMTPTEYRQLYLRR